jgi:hypothetical protein
LMPSSQKFLFRLYIAANSLLPKFNLVWPACTITANGSSAAQLLEMAHPHQINRMIVTCDMETGRTN